MLVDTLPLEGLLLIKPTKYSDERGFFLEGFRKESSDSIGLPTFVQENHSFSVQKTVRGMHFQTGHCQAKLITVIKGSIFDVAFDMRPKSKTYKQWIGVVLDETNCHQLFIPGGYAHGFCALEDAHVVYKLSTLYDKELEKGFYWKDPSINIKWPFSDPILSKRDQTAPLFDELCLKDEKVLS